MTPQLRIHLVDPAKLIMSRINSRWSSGALDVFIDRTHVDPVTAGALLEAGNRAMKDLIPLIKPDRPPVVRYFMERNISDRLVAVDFTPYQADVYLEEGLMPQDLADELAAHSTHLLRHFPL